MTKNKKIDNGVAVCYTYTTSGFLPKGWVCPICGRAVSPNEKYCDCIKYVPWIPTPMPYIPWSPQITWDVVNNSKGAACPENMPKIFNS